MNLKRILVLAALVAGGGLYISQVELASDIQKAQQKNPFAELSSAQFAHLAVSSPEGTVKLLNTSPDTSAPSIKNFTLTPKELAPWQIDGIPGSEVDKVALSALLQGLRGLSLESSVSAADVGSDLSVFGLVNPEVSVTVRMAKGEERTLSFGSFNDFVSLRYLKLSDDAQLYLVNNDIYNAAKKKQDDFRRRTPIEFADSELRKFEVVDNGSRIALESGDNGEWKLTSPIVATGSDFAISSINRELRNLRATEFIDGVTDLAPFGLANPAISLTLSFAESAKREPLVVSLGVAASRASGAKAEEKEYFFTVSGKKPVFRLQSEFNSRLSKAVDFYRQKKLFQFDMNAVTAFEIAEAGKPALVVAQDAGKWKVNGAKEGDEPFIRQVLTNMTELEAQSFVETAKAPSFDSPKLTITITLNTGAKKSLVVVSGSAPDTYVGAVGDRTEPFLFTSAGFEKIVPHPEALVVVAPEPTPTEAAAAAPVK